VRRLPRPVVEAVVADRAARLGLHGLIVASILGSSAPLAVAHPNPDATDEIPAAPPTYEAGGVTVDEHLGARVPLDATFRTQDGTLVTLGQILGPGVTAGGNELPTILTFNYSDCPMLCSLQLNGLSAALPAIAVPAPDRDGRPTALRVGEQYRIVTIDLEPNDTLGKLQKMRDKYIDRLPEAQRAAARKGWTFLAAAVPGDGAAIRRVAETVGFKYIYISERAEWAHPAALILLSAQGAVTRYVYGIEFDPRMMRESLFKAGTSEPATAVGFMNRCYHYAPDANNYSRGGMLALRLGAAAFLVLLLSLFGLMHFLKKQHRHGEMPS
jgi:protein SCO1/2